MILYLARFIINQFVFVHEDKSIFEDFSVLPGLNFSILEHWDERSFKSGLLQDKLRRSTELKSDMPFTNIPSA